MRVGAVARQELRAVARPAGEDPPAPGRSSTLWICVPSGISASGSALPIRGSMFWPDTTVSPTPSPTGARMYRFSPSA